MSIQKLHRDQKSANTRGGEPDIVTTNGAAFNNTANISNMISSQ